MSRLLNFGFINYGVYHAQSYAEWDAGSGFTHPLDGAGRRPTPRRSCFHGNSAGRWCHQCYPPPGGKGGVVVGGRRQLLETTTLINGACLGQSPPPLLARELSKVIIYPGGR